MNELVIFSRLSTIFVDVILCYMVHTYFELLMNKSISLFFIVMCLSKQVSNVFNAKFVNNF